MQKLFRWFFDKPYLAIAWTALLLILCLMPKDQVPTGLGWDKLHHFGAFGILAALWYWSTLKVWPVILGGVLYGVGIEIAQGNMGVGRAFDWYDAVANSLGIIIAIPIARWVRRWLIGT
ncbi:VanZ family protein [Runella zeae]|jgi:VanZ family protein|uniref:VanZ family protein n=1 Tax=Runella zeae TaxID=94255 RepID=UPI0023553109|nr:VanZ family protein [Runella zeae]